MQDFALVALLRAQHVNTRRDISAFFTRALHRMNLQNCEK